VARHGRQQGGGAHEGVVGEGGPEEAEGRAGAAAGAGRSGRHLFFNGRRGFEAAQGRTRTPRGGERVRGRERTFTESPIVAASRIDRPRWHSPVDPAPVISMRRWGGRFGEGRRGAVWTGSESGGRSVRQMQHGGGGLGGGGRRSGRRVGGVGAKEEGERLRERGHDCAG
jgi:hypothetical protein